MFRDDRGLAEVEDKERVNDKSRFEEAGVVADAGEEGAAFFFWRNPKPCRELLLLGSAIMLPRGGDDKVEGVRASTSWEFSGNYDIGTTTTKVKK